MYASWLHITGICGTEQPKRIQCKVCVCVGLVCKCCLFSPQLINFFFRTSRPCLKNSFHYIVKGVTKFFHVYINTLYMLFSICFTVACCIHSKYILDHLWFEWGEYFIKLLLIATFTYVYCRLTTMSGVRVHLM